MWHGQIQYHILTSIKQLWHSHFICNVMINVFNIDEFSSNFNLKNMILTYTKDFSWKIWLKLLVQILVGSQEYKRIMFIFLLSYLGQWLFFVEKIPHFAKNKKSQATSSREHFWKISKRIATFQGCFYKNHQHFFEH
jgi:hypothetical protein